MLANLGQSSASRHPTKTVKIARQFRVRGSGVGEIIQGRGVCLTALAFHLLTGPSVAGIQVISFPGFRPSFLSRDLCATADALRIPFFYGRWL
jgi:hypothetical protein